MMVNLEHSAKILNCLQNQNLGQGGYNRFSLHGTGFNCMLQAHGLKCTELSALIVNV